MADNLADALMKDLAKDCRIQRHGHQHWVKVSRHRSLRSDRIVPELDETMTLTLTTRCPEKWISIDMETGELWSGSATGWRRASPDERQEALACLAPVSAQRKGKRAS